MRDSGGLCYLGNCHGNLTLTRYHHCPQPPSSPFTCPPLTLQTYVREQVSVLIVQGGVREKYWHTEGGCSHWAIKWRLWLSFSHHQRSSVMRCCPLWNGYMTKDPPVSFLSTGESWVEKFPMDVIYKLCMSIALFLFHASSPLKPDMCCCASVALPFLLDH